MLRLSIPAFLLLFFVSAAAQDRAPYLCPNLSIKGPKPFPERGGTAKFTVEVTQFGQEREIKYNWHISPGKILSGQGTPTVEVEMPPNGTLAVTVDIAGTPGDSSCPRSKTAFLTWDAPPEAEMITSVRGISFDTSLFTVKKAIDAASKYPSNHLYIFLGHKRDATEETVRKREVDLLSRLPETIERARYSIVRVSGTEDFAEMWRIPPGASNPTCKACDTQLQCPAVSVTGPAGITQPGEKFVFTGALDGDVPKNVSFQWEISDGNIVEGQGTLKLSVVADRSLSGVSITVTLNVLGLSEGCLKSASETVGFPGPHNPILMDEFGRLANKVVRTRLNKFFTELSNNPSSQGYLIVYGTEKEVAARERLIVDSVLLRNFDRSRITIVRGGTHPSGKAYTKLYRVPPGADNPAP